jgi:hypothetical protein
MQIAVGNAFGMQPGKSMSNIDDLNKEVSVTA